MLQHLTTSYNMLQPRRPKGTFEKVFRNASGSPWPSRHRCCPTYIALVKTRTFGLRIDWTSALWIFLLVTSCPTVLGVLKWAHMKTVPLKSYMVYPSLSAFLTRRYCPKTAVRSVRIQPHPSTLPGTSHLHPTCIPLTYHSSDSPT